jgi:hypothetical protein
MGMEEEEKDMLLGLRPCDDTSKDQQIIHVAWQEREKMDSTGQAAERAVISMDVFTASRWCTANIERKAAKPTSRWSWVAHYSGAW